MGSGLYSRTSTILHLLPRDPNHASRCFHDLSSTPLDSWWYHQSMETEEMEIKERLINLRERMCEALEGLKDL
jgi:hypothetical protein